jgi:UDP-GlcNAc:undecaprenyl-phosphate/decaprenyl-phosphate GlcNAc-1-phosphate transferase
VRHYLAVFVVTAGVTFLVTPLARRLSLRLGWIDRPSDRKVHPKPTPTVGGAAIFVGVLAGLLVSRVVPFFDGIYETSSELDATVIAATMILLVGVVDDTRGVSALGKLTAQILVAGVLVLLGVQLLWFYFPGQGVLSLSPDLAVPLTVAWVVLTMNAVNLIDGLDGLAAGIVTIAAVCFFVYMARSPDGSVDASVAALLSAIAAGGALGFLPWNFHQAKIFMGDSGALLLGLLLAVATVSGVGRNVQGPSGGDVAVVAIPVAVPLFVLAIPLIDVILAVIRRVRRGTSIGHADKEHIHHRLMEVGHSHRQSVLLMYLWSALISVSALAVAFIDGRTTVAVFWAIAALVGTLVPWSLGRMARRRASEAPVDEPATPASNGHRAHAASGSAHRRR